MGRKNTSVGGARGRCPSGWSTSFSGGAKRCGPLRWVGQIAAGASGTSHRATGAWHGQAAVAPAAARGARGAFGSGRLLAAWSSIA